MAKKAVREPSAPHAGRAAAKASAPPAKASRIKRLFLISLLIKPIGDVIHLIESIES